MTTLTKKVTRKTKHAESKGRKIVVTLHDGDVLGFRLERDRGDREVMVPISAAYTWALTRKAGLV